MSAWKWFDLPPTIHLWLLLTLCALEAKGQNCTCGEIGKCRAAKVCLYDKCNIENVALGKPAYMKRSTSLNHPACMAVNGDNSTTFEVDTATGNTNCAESGLSDYSAWWAVDLGQDYTVSNITIYRRAGSNGFYRMADLVLKVDNQLCHTFPNHSNKDALMALPERIDITCGTPIVGQVVRLEKVNPGTDSLYYYINICEVQVWGCASGYYGSECITCGHCAANSTCNTVTGQCPRGCLAGWYGQRCDQTSEIAESTTTATTRAVPSFVTAATATTLNGAATAASTISSSTSTHSSFSVKPESPDSNSLVAPIVGAIIGGFVALGLIIAVALVCLRRRKAKREQTSRNEEPSQPVSRQSQRLSNISAKSRAEGDDSLYAEIRDSNITYESLVPEDQRPDERSVYTNPVFKDTATGSGTTVYYENKD